MAFFKEYKKKSISDDRQTFEAAVNEKLEFFNEPENKSDPQKSQDQIEFLLDIMPLCREYYGGDGEQINEVFQCNTNPENIQHYICANDNVTNKGYIYNEYRSLVGEKHSYSKTTDTSLCKVCNVVLRQDFTESTVVCPECGISEHLLDCGNDLPNTTLVPSTAERVEITPYYSYKRSNHFNEWLSQLQAKETTEISQDVYDKLLLELKKERITDISKITHTKIRGFLKKLKLNKFYEHIPHIILKLKGEEAARIPPEVEEQLRYMFHLIQVPFEKHCPKNRKNFMSYSYTLYKMVEILGHDDLLEKFPLPLLKSREKLVVQDKIWKGICQELEWEFIATI